MTLRLLLGALLAGAVAGAAFRARSLSASGAWAAVAVGAAAAAAGWRWAALLIAWFVASSALTRWGRAEKVARTASVVPEGSARTAWQVAANGSVFATAALAATLAADARWGVAALGALAAAAADTWATEVGTRWGGTPRSITSFAPLAPGTSGGVTVAGTAASVAGALAVAAAAPWVLTPSTWSLAGAPPWGAPGSAAAGWSVIALVAAAGVAGSLADSLLGALVQSRRRCDACDAWTERAVHVCGTATRHARGLRWMTNDTVNLLATLSGATVALAGAAAFDPTP